MNAQNFIKQIEDTIRFNGVLCDEVIEGYQFEGRIGSVYQLHNDNYIFDLPVSIFSLNGISYIITDLVDSTTLVQVCKNEEIGSDMLPSVVMNLEDIKLLLLCLRETNHCFVIDTF